MKFADSYFESEVREGFFVAGMMKRAWAAQLEILTDVDRICRKHQIAYFADWGTLLGAVRHRGFIPWDDDLDICMKRDDYNRFLSIAARELPENYYLHNIYTDENYSEMFTRVLNSRQINFKKDFLDKYHGCPYGMGIDIFVMDFVAPDLEKEREQSELISSVIGIVQKLDAGELSRGELNSDIAWLKHTFGIDIDPQVSLRKQILLLAEKLYSIYGEEESSEITMMQLWTLNKEYRMPKEYYQESIRIPFETMTIPVPVFYDAVLNKKYGNYMLSAKRGGSHDYPLYHRQEEALIQKIGGNPYAYVYNKEEQDFDSGRRGASVKKQMRTLLHTLEVQLDVLNHCKRDTERMPAILAQCQETAIALGTMIEEQKGEGTITVRNLEEYCELIYQMHEAAARGDYSESDNSCLLMQQKAGQIKETIKKEIDLRYEVIFFPCRASEWKFMESVYRAAKEDEDCVPYVIPVPYFYKNPDQSAKEMRDDTKLFPPDVLAVKYDAFDFAVHCPDVMYIQNPYDEYDAAMSVHPFFYASNLKKYTDCLVYISPYLTDEIDGDDERAVENMKYCCAAPGVVYADWVIVQSKRMRQVYIDILTEFAGEDTRRMWEEKILGIGSPELDADVAETIADEALLRKWEQILRKPDKSRKNIVLYGTSTAVLLQQKEAALAKIKSVLSFLEKKKDEIALIWIPDMPMETYSEKKYRDVLEEYQKLVHRYQAEGWGILGKPEDAEQAVSLCSAYYGDGGYMAQMCIRKGIPVMIQNSLVLCGENMRKGLQM